MYIEIHNEVHMDTLHIKIGEKTNEELKQLAKSRGMTVAELVRQAIAICYQIEMMGMSDTQKQAIEAYKGGFISLGKLSELMGTNPIDMRKWLNEHNISQFTKFSEDDAANAE